MNWNRETLKIDFSLESSWYKDNKERVFFYIGLWMGMRKGYSTNNPPPPPEGKMLHSARSVVGTDLNINIRPNIHDSKDMLSIWWKQKGVIYFELLKSGDSITSDRLRLQTDSFELWNWKKIWTKYERRHDKIILLHEHAWP